VPLSLPSRCMDHIKLRQRNLRAAAATRGRTTVGALWGALIVALLCATSAQPSPPTDASAILWDKAPSPNDKSAWRWAMAAPGMNIYVSDRYARREGSVVTAWIDREYYRNAAGIDKSIIELRQFDCARMATRRLSDVSVNNTVPTWQHELPGSLVEHVALDVCLKMDAQVLKPEGARG